MLRTWDRLFFSSDKIISDFIFPVFILYLCWWITDEMYDKKLKEYKERQSAILTEMHIHSDADEEFYLTANMVLKLAQRALQIFKSSEVDEKRQFLNFLLQNCQLEGKKLSFSMRYPFDRILATSNQPIGLRGQGSNL